MVDLPSVGKASKQPDKVIQIVIQKDERLELVSDGKTDTTTLTAVAASVKRMVGEETNTAVVISADRSVKYETVVQVMDTLQRAGIARVGLSVQLAP
jgi:biopolymer transport protein TolR